MTQCPPPARPRIPPSLKLLRTGLWLLLLLASHPALAKPVAVRIQGIDGELLANVRARIDLVDLPCDAPRWQLLRQLEKFDQSIREALRALGRYHPRIDEKLEPAGDCWRIGIEVKPGPPVRVAALDLRIDGAAVSDPEFQRLRQKLPLNVGDPLHHGRYEKLKRRLLDLAIERGYFRARFLEKRLEVDPGRNQAFIRLHFDSGPRFRIGRIEIDEQPYAPELLQQLIPLDSGQLYSGKALQQAYRKLADSGYFDSVEISPLLDQLQQDEVPLRIRLKPRRKYAWQLGIGVSSDIGPQLSARFENRRVNPLGHQLQLEAQASPVRSGAGMSYRIPLFDSSWRQLDLTTSYLHEDSDGALNDTLTASARLLRLHGRWSETAFVELQRETSKVEGLSFDSLLLMPGWRWERSRIDDPRRPRRGEHIYLEGRVASSQLLSDTSLFQVRAGARARRPLGSGSVIARLDLGSTWIPEFSTLPASLRFFAGGDQSVRGYAYESLGPTADNGEPAGGRHLLVTSLEYEHPIAENWGLALFVDHGNAFDDLGEDFHTGIGIGLRWYSPVGPLRIDIGVPRDDPDTDYRLHFSFGAGL